MLPSESIVPVFWRVWLAPRLTFDQLRSRGVTWWDWVVVGVIGILISVADLAILNVTGLGDMVDATIGSDGSNFNRQFDWAFAFAAPVLIAMLSYSPGIPLILRLTHSLGGVSSREDASVLVLVSLIAGIGLTFAGYALYPLIASIPNGALPLHSGWLFWLLTLVQVVVVFCLTATLAHFAFSPLSLPRAWFVAFAVDIVIIFLVCVIAVTATGLAWWMDWISFEETP
jgi:hypothetical protein